jgi:ligand-binding sensor domain-containing protein
MKYPNIVALILFFCCIGSNSHAQNAQIGEWKAYPSLNTVRSLSYNPQGAEYWASTSGGVFRAIKGDTTQFDVFTTIDGLYAPEPSVILWHDSSQKIWFGFIDGTLQSLDPETRQFQTFTDISRNNRFPSKRINHFYSLDDDLIISTDFGLVRWDASRNLVLESFTNFGTIGNSFRINAVILKSDTLYAATANGLIWANKNDDWLLSTVWKSISLSEASINGPLLTIGAAATDSLFVSTATSNYVLLNGNMTQINRFPEVISRYKNMGNKLLAVSNSHVYTSDLNGNLVQVYRNTQAGRVFRDIVETENHVMLGTSNQGLIGLDLISAELSRYSPAGPFLNFFSEMHVDNGNLISASSFNPGRVATTFVESGFYIFDGEDWKNFNFRTNEQMRAINGESYYSSAISKDYYAFGSWGKGIALYTKETESIQTFLPANTPELTGIDPAAFFMVVSGLDFDRNGYLWATNYFSTNNALYRYDIENDSWLSFRKTPIVSTNDHYFGLTIDSFGQMWIPLFAPTGSGVGRGVLVYDIGDPETNSDDQGYQLLSDSDRGFLPSDMVTALAQDKRGEMWVGTTRGLVRYLFPERIIEGNANDRRAEYLRNVGNDSIYFRDIDVTTIAVDAANQKWIGTSANGLWHITENGDRIIKRFTTENSPLPSNTIRSVAINDQNGMIYIATDLGLVSFVDVTTESYSGRETLKVYPNPLVYKDLEQNRIIIEGLSQATTVRILNTSGVLIDEFNAKGGRVQWTPRQKDGSYLASGVYFVIAVDENGGEKGVGKFAVVR